LPSPQNPARRRLLVPEGDGVEVLALAIFHHKREILIVGVNGQRGACVAQQEGKSMLARCFAAEHPVAYVDDVRLIFGHAR